MIVNVTKVTNITKLIMLKNERKKTTNTTSFRLQLIEQWEEEELQDDIYGGTRG